MTEILSVAGLCKSYEKFHLRDVSFTINAGSISGFIGRNGAGKTTTLRSLLDMVHADAGEIRFFGADLAGRELDIKQQIGFVGGGINYYPQKKLKVITAVNRRFFRDWDEAAYARYLEMFYLDEDKTPAQLSAGMKVKYSLALALSHQARLLILDEPTSGLDPVSRDDLLDVFLDLVRQEDISILFSTHITSDLDKCADDIIYIKEGRVRAAEPLDDFLARYSLLTCADADAPPEELRPYLRGLKREKRGWSALIEGDTPTGALTPVPATLEQIMIHLEKEAE